LVFPGPGSLVWQPRYLRLPSPFQTIHPAGELIERQRRDPAVHCPIFLSLTLIHPRCSTSIVKLRRANAASSGISDPASELSPAVTAARIDC
jgi:hypothetical protein